MVKKILILLLFVCCAFIRVQAQSCSLPGMTPDQAIPVCGTGVFHQDLVTQCTGPSVAHSGCSETVTSDKSFWYKFTCYQSGTLGFLITGRLCSDDYDWILVDVTGKNPTDVFSDASMQVSLNTYGTLGCGTGAPFPNSPTGCTPTGSGNVHCQGDASTNSPFNGLANITIGHNYLLMVTNWTSGSTAGYDLTFSGGTAVITDPTEPHLQNSRAICDGTQAVVKFNKRMKCTSLSSNGSEFTISPSVANVIGAVGYGCSTGFDMDSVILTLDKSLSPGNYTISIKNGSDGNTVLDNCDRPVPVGETVPMVVYPVFPTPMDSIIKPGCAPTELQLDFSKQIRYIKCNSIAADGSDFGVNKISGIGGPVTVIGASGVCSADGLTAIIKIKLAAPIQTKGVYELQLQTGTDGNTIINECGQPTAAGSKVTFTTVDTVNADFTYKLNLGCTRDTINYFHDGRNGANAWKWTFDNLRTSSLQNPVSIYASFGQKTAQLIVSNGVCKDTSDVKTIALDNGLKAQFEATEIICPGDLATFKDNSIGQVNAWSWNFGNNNTSLLQQPQDQTYPSSKDIREVPVKLIVTNNLGCKDTVVEYIKVVSNCYIAVPNAFTPNGDGLNDYLYPLNAYKAKDLIFKVYNRFGQLLFQTTDWTVKWDGTFKGQGADPATYVWILQYTNIDTGKRVEQKGTTVLIR